MRRVLLAAALLGLLVALVAPVGATPAHEETTFAIQIEGDGDGEFTVSMAFTLENESDRAAFDRLREEYEAGESVGPTVEPYEAAAEQVDPSVDRSMEIQDVGRSSRVESTSNGSLGVLELQFVWTNFAVVTEERVVVEDPFKGGWFGDLGSSQRLSIEPPAEYRVPVTANPSTDIDDGSLHWEGPQAFGADEPRVIFETASVPGADLDRSVVAAVALIAIFGLALFAWRRGWLTGGGEDEPAGTDTATGPEPDDGEAPGEAEPTEAGLPLLGGEDADEEIDESLLSDEERVEALLRRNDGRMKQARIVEQTRWSNAKVSQLLSSMAEEGRIEKLRIGRENLISLPEDDDFTKP